MIPLWAKLCIGGASGGVVGGFIAWLAQHHAKKDFASFLDGRLGCTGCGCIPCMCDEIFGEIKPAGKEE